jgi:orotate phosphoribosyltransferase
MNLEQLKLQYIEGIYQTKALLIKADAFTLQSGKKSHIYLNHRHFLSNHHYLKLIAEIYHQLASAVDGDYMLGAVDSIMSPIIVGAMSGLFERDYVVIRKTPLSHGTQEYIYGAIKKEVVLIDDMTSTGDTLIDAAEKIREKRGTVRYAIISAYRDNTAIKNLQDQHIQPLTIASFEEIIKQLHSSLTPQEKEILMKENEACFHSF